MKNASIIDQRVIQAERAKLADKYEACFRRIFKIAPEPISEGNARIRMDRICEEIERVYQPRGRKR